MKKLIILAFILLSISSCNVTTSVVPKSIHSEVNSSIIDGFGYVPGMYLMKESNDSILSYLQQ